MIYINIKSSILDFKFIMASVFGMYPCDFVPEQYYLDNEDGENYEPEMPYPIPANEYCYAEVWKQIGLDMLTGIDENGDEFDVLMGEPDMEDKLAFERELYNSLFKAV